MEQGRIENAAGNLVFIPLRGEQEVENIHAIWMRENDSQPLAQFTEWFFASA